MSYTPFDQNSIELRPRTLMQAAIMTDRPAVICKLAAAYPDTVLCAYPSSTYGNRPLPFAALDEEHPHEVRAAFSRVAATAAASSAVAHQAWRYGTGEASAEHGRYTDLVAIAISRGMPEMLQIMLTNPAFTRSGCLATTDTGAGVPFIAADGKPMLPYLDLMGESLELRQAFHPEVAGLTTQLRSLSLGELLESVGGGLQGLANHVKDAKGSIRRLEDLLCQGPPEDLAVLHTMASSSNVMGQSPAEVAGDLFQKMAQRFSSVLWELDVDSKAGRRVQMVAGQLANAIWCNSGADPRTSAGQRAARVAALTSARLENYGAFRILMEKAPLEFKPEEDSVLNNAMDSFEERWAKDLERINLARAANSGAFERLNEAVRTTMLQDAPEVAAPAARRPRI